MTTLEIRNTTPEKIDLRTITARYDHLVMGRWIGWTQAWTWEGGDAIVVTCGNLGGRVESWAAVRLGSKIVCWDISSGGIRGFLAAHGYESKVI